MIAAMLLYIMFCGCMIGGSLWGTGKHLFELTSEQRTTAMEYWWLCNISYALSSVLAKVSVCIFLLRVMPFPCHRAALYTVTALAVCSGIPFFVLLVIQCSPVSFWWTRMRGDTNGRCGYVDAIAIMLYIFSASSAIFDLTVALLPVILVRNLQMNRRTKAAVAGLLGMACVASIAIIIRLAFVQTIHDPDYLYGTVQIAIWSCIEVGLSITAGSLATTRPLFRILHNRSSSPYNPSDDPLTPSNDRNKHRRSISWSEPYPSSRSRRTSNRILTLENDLGFNFGFGRNNSISTSSRRSRSSKSTSRPSTSRNKRRSGVTTEGRPSSNFYEPYIGVEMLKMQSTADAEGGRTDDTEGSSHPAPGTELLDPITDPNSVGSGGNGGRPEGRQVPEPTPTARSRIGVHRTFRLSSSNDVTSNEATGSGKESGSGRNSDSVGG
ncbi:uncharacterized protein BDW70DRAFT_128329 [Aspergillus foveolatus]|uniref:uncharacterized protein n=1 Tax=Aspergillus foveolatus TaxID=210207 RepID=UPI003CCD09ED